MANRQERRAQASGTRPKRGHKAMQRGLATGSSVATRAVRRAAEAYMADDVAEVDLSLPGFDDAWFRLAPALYREMGEDYADFRDEEYGAAAIDTRRAADGRLFELGLFLCPVVGDERSILDYLASPDKLDALAQSFRRCGVFSETSTTIAFPVAVAPESFSVLGTGPAAVERLTECAAQIMAQALSGGPTPSAAEIADAMSMFLDMRPLEAEPGPERMSVRLVSGAIPVMCLDARDGNEVAKLDDQDYVDLMDERERRREDAIEAWLREDAVHGEGFQILEPMPWEEVGPELAITRCLAFMVAQAGVDDRPTDGLRQPFERIHARRDEVSGDISVTAEVGTTSVEHSIPIHLAAWNPGYVLDALHALAGTVEVRDEAEAFGFLPPAQ